MYFGPRCVFTMSISVRYGIFFLCWEATECWEHCASETNYVIVIPWDVRLYVEITLRKHCIFVPICVFSVYGIFFFVGKQLCVVNIEWRYDQCERTTLAVLSFDCTSLDACEWLSIRPAEACNVSSAVSVVSLRPDFFY